MTTVYDLFGTLLDTTGVDMDCRDLFDCHKDLQSIPLASHVGECSRLAITKAAELLAILDSHPDVRRKVLSAVVIHIRILLHG